MVKCVIGGETEFTLPHNPCCHLLPSMWLCYRHGVFIRGTSASESSRSHNCQPSTSQQTSRYETLSCQLCIFVIVNRLKILLTDLFYGFLELAWTGKPSLVIYSSAGRVKCFIGFVMNPLQWDRLDLTVLFSLHVLGLYSNSINKLANVMRSRALN